MPRKGQNKRISNMKFREKINLILKTTRVQVFKSDPITWIPQRHVALYKREIAWHLYQITHLINIESWNIIADILFQQHSELIFSLIYQLGGTEYRPSTLSFITSSLENYNVVKNIASIYKTNIILYKPNYVPQYLRAKHYINLITPMNQNTIKNTFIIYSEPVEYLYSMDYRFQLSSLIDLRFEESIKSFFKLNTCLIKYQDFDKIGYHGDGKIDLQYLKQTFYMDKAKARYKAVIALRCGLENSENVPSDWWPYSDDRPLTIAEFVLLLIKVSTTYSGTTYIIYKSMYYCICGDIYEAETIICEIQDDGGLSIPDNFENQISDTKYYKRGSLLSLVNNKYLFVN